VRHPAAEAQADLPPKRLALEQLFLLLYTEGGTDSHRPCPVILCSMTRTENPSFRTPRRNGHPKIQKRAKPGPPAATDPNWPATSWKSHPPTWPSTVN